MRAARLPNWCCDRPLNAIFSSRGSVEADAALVPECLVGPMSAVVKAWSRPPSPNPGILASLALYARKQLILAGSSTPEQPACRTCVITVARPNDQEGYGEREKVARVAFARNADHRSAKPRDFG